MSDWPDGLTEQQIDAWANARGLGIMFTTDDDIPLILPRHVAQVVYLPGDGSACYFDDHVMAEVGHWTPMQRAVAVARLKVVGELIAATDKPFGPDNA